MTEASAFYTPLAQGFAAGLHTRGPWSPGHQHAGPPAALLARAIENAFEDALENASPAEAPMQVLRITFEILRPVPIAALQVQTEALHAGRKLQVIEATLSDESCKPLIRARAVAVRSSKINAPAVPDPFAAPASPENCPPHEFGFFTEDVGYHTAMEMRHARGALGGGHVAMWMRMRIPLVVGEDPTPLQRVVIAADSGNGISPVLDPARYTFINPDLSVYLHRPLTGKWVCLDAQTIVQHAGVGLADTRLYDMHGPIGRSDQSLIIQARN